MVERVQVNAVQLDGEVPTLKLDRAPGLAYIHLTQDDAHLLEKCKIFLFIKGKLFLMSPLVAILDHGLDEIPENYFNNK
ncbi:MAG: hypothetical protein RBG13Loki_3828 [Promethearchaeota archaeon CR_4]|nr:MAG: hypothetical protein RBG13Loki_3828 [Candidatus Lokiarchaeota archaeon CR_4]